MDEPALRRLIDFTPDVGAMPLAGFISMSVIMSHLPGPQVEFARLWPVYENSWNQVLSTLDLNVIIIAILPLRS